MSGFPPRYVVAFIDLLGMGRQFEDIPEFPNGKADEECFDAPFMRVLQFRESLSTMKNSIEKQLPESQKRISGMQNEDQATIQKYFKAKVGLEFIGDSGMLNVCLVDDQHAAPLKSILSLVSQLSVEMLSHLSMGAPLRGGISVGRCSQEDSGLIGQAVARAYRLESKVARYPRIVIHESLKQYLDEAEGVARKNTSKLESCAELTLVGSIRDLIDTDQDGCLILDYLGVLSKVGLRNDCLLPTVCRFIEESFKGFEKSGNLELKGRYQKLINYFKKKECWIVESA